ncbi:MAG: hypothetical protein L6R48_19585 [Planctomycetes bacterium]|nr:hypothetical protein [Planctomycetota bacterium]
MNGKIRVVQGFRIRPKDGGQLEVDHFSKHSNPDLPRRFIWTNAKNTADLDRVLESLARGDFYWLDQASNEGLADFIDYPGTTARDAPQGPVKLRYSARRLASVCQGQERLVVPSGGILTLRTNRNGCTPRQLVRTLVSTGILSPTEVSLEHGPARPLDLQLPAGVEVFAPDRQWMAGVTEPLWATGRRSFFQDGFVFRRRITKPEIWEARSLMPLDDDQPSRFRWCGPPDQRLTAFLAAIHTHSTLGMKMAIRTKRAFRLRYAPTQMDDWAIVSPTRLRAVLRGEDPLQIRARPGCLTLHVHRHRCVPTVIPVWLVSTKLDRLRQIALRAREAAYLPLQARRPAHHVADCVIRKPDHRAGAPGQAPRRQASFIVAPANPQDLSQRSGGQLLMDSALGRWDDRLAWARGECPPDYAGTPQHVTVVRPDVTVMTHAAVNARASGSYFRATRLKKLVIDIRIWDASQSGWQIRMRNWNAMLQAVAETQTNIPEMNNEPPGATGAIVRG